MADKHKDCKYYDKIDDEKGECRRYPPSFLKGDVDRYSIVAKNEKCCGDFVAKDTP